MNIQEMGEAVVAAAEREWYRDICEPSRAPTSPDVERWKAAISEYLAGCGWTWPEVYPYQGHEHPEWCGLFAGKLWREQGLKLDIVKSFFPSTYRLDCYGQYLPLQGVKPLPKPATPRLYAVLNEQSTEVPFEPAAGDIVVIGPSGSGPGVHIGVNRFYDAARKTFHTTEGNGGGIGPDGKQRLGVVHAERVLGGPGWHVRRVYRPAPDDFEAV